MAITIQQNPIRQVASGRGYVPLGPCVWSVSSSNSAQPNFKFLIQIYDGATEVAKFAVAPNPADRCHFDAWEINKSYVKPDVANSAQGSIHYHGTTASPGNKFFLQATNSIKKLQIRFGEKYDVGGDPVEFPGAGTLGADAWDMYILPYRTQFSDDLNPAGLTRWTLSTTPVGTPLTAWRLGYFNGDNAATWGITGIQIPVTVNDWGVMSFPHDALTIDSFNNTYDLHYQIYNGNVSIGTQTTIINAGNGAGPGNSTTAADKLIYFAAYPKNLANANVIANPTLWPDTVFNPNWTHYIITIRRQTGSALVSNQMVFYRVQPDNCRFDTMRLAWVCDPGGYDYWNFTKKNEINWNKEGKTYDSIIGTFDETNYIQPGYSRSTTVYGQMVHKVYTVSSDWVSEGTITYLRQLFSSREVHLLDTANTTHIPVTIVENSYKEEKIRSSRLVQITFQVKLSQPLNI